jgi:hypothetical protein
MLVSASAPLNAQQSSQTKWEWWNTWFWNCGPAYPEGFVAGTTTIFGKYKWTIPHRGGLVRGVEAGGDIGPGGLSARVGWTQLFAYDAGFDGYSFDAVYVRPWLVKWGLDTGANYVGGGVTRHFGWFRFSGAVLVNATSQSHDVGASAKVDMLWELH